MRTRQVCKMMVSKPNRTWTVAISACAMVLALALAGCGSGNTATAGADHGITVSASSETKVVPDKARVSVSVVNEAKTAEECQAENATRVNAVIDALAKLGVAETSIQTNYSDLSPRYGSLVTDSKSKSEEAAYDEWTITGYEMTTSLTISDLEISSVGAIVEACVGAGANDANGIEYYASNYDEAYNEALAKALETAKAKADGIASATGANLGKVVNVVEGYQDTSARYAAMENDIAFESAADGAAAKTMPGQVDITANVTVTYAIG